MFLVPDSRKGIALQLNQSVCSRACLFFLLVACFFQRFSDLIGYDLHFLSNSPPIFCPLSWDGLKPPLPGLQFRLAKQFVKDVAETPALHFDNDRLQIGDDLQIGIWMIGIKMDKH